MESVKKKITQTPSLIGYTVDAKPVYCVLRERERPCSVEHVTTGTVFAFVRPEHQINDLVLLFRRRLIRIQDKLDLI